MDRGVERGHVGRVRPPSRRCGTGRPGLARSDRGSRRAPRGRRFSCWRWPVRWPGRRSTDGPSAHASLAWDHGVLLLGRLAGRSSAMAATFCANRPGSVEQEGDSAVVRAEVMVEMGENRTPRPEHIPRELPTRHFRPTWVSRRGPPTGGVPRLLSGDASRLFGVAHRSRRRRTSPNDIFAVRGGGTTSMLTA